MHEFSVAKSLIDLVEKYALRENMVKVKEIKIKVGILSGVEPYLLREAFEYLKTENILTARAVLNIEIEGIKIKCEKCNSLEEREEYIFFCPYCGSEDVAIWGGDSLDVVKITGLT